jgi:hypothetical protein
MSDLKWNASPYCTRAGVEEFPRNIFPDCTPGYIRVSRWWIWDIVFVVLVVDFVVLVVVFIILVVVFVDFIVLFVVFSVLVVVFVVLIVFLLF